MVQKLWMQIPFFCGSAPECWDPGRDIPDIMLARYRTSGKGWILRFISGHISSQYPTRYLAAYPVENGPGMCCVGYLDPVSYPF